MQDSIRQHISEYVYMRQAELAIFFAYAYVSIRQHTSAYVSIRQHPPRRGPLVAAAQGGSGDSPVSIR